MPVEFECPDCGTRYRIDDKFAGRKAKCKNCGSLVIVPPPEDANAGAAAEIPVSPSDVVHVDDADAIAEDGASEGEGGIPLVDPGAPEKEEKPSPKPEKRKKKKRRKKKEKKKPAKEVVVAEEAVAEEAVTDGDEPELSPGADIAGHSELEDVETQPEEPAGEEISADVISVAVESDTPSEEKDAEVPTEDGDGEEDGDGDEGEDGEKDEVKETIGRPKTQITFDRVFEDPEYEAAAADFKPLREPEEPINPDFDTELPSPDPAPIIDDIDDEDEFADDDRPATPEGDAIPVKSAESIKYLKLEEDKFKSAVSDKPSALAVPASNRELHSDGLVAGSGKDGFVADTRLHPAAFVAALVALAIVLVVAYTILKGNDAEENGNGTETPVAQNGDAEDIPGTPPADMSEKPHFYPLRDARVGDFVEGKLTGGDTIRRITIEKVAPDGIVTMNSKTGAATSEQKWRTTHDVRMMSEFGEVVEEKPGQSIVISGRTFENCVLVTTRKDGVEYAWYLSADVPVNGIVLCTNLTAAKRIYEITEYGRGR